MSTVCSCWAGKVGSASFSDINKPLKVNSKQCYHVHRLCKEMLTIFKPFLQNNHT